MKSKKIFSVIMVCMLAVVIFCLSGCSSKITDITLSDCDITLTLGESRQIEVTAKPESAPLANLTWSAADSNIVSVEDGLVKANNVGSTVVKVVTENGISKSCNVTVTDKEITNISLSDTALTLLAGNSIQLTAKVEPADAKTSNLKWSSDDKSVATVNSEGRVTAVAAGITNIVCSVPNGAEASCTVTVKGTDSSNSGGTIEIIYKNGHYNPKYTYSASDFVFPESSVRKLTKSEIVSTLNSMSGGSISDSYAQDAINEIYARNGYVFKTPSIREYYESMPWYYADASFTTSDFSSVERYNIDLISKYA